MTDMKMVMVKNVQMAMVIDAMMANDHENDVGWPWKQCVDLKMGMLMLEMITGEQDLHMMIKRYPPTQSMTDKAKC